MNKLQDRLSKEGRLAALHFVLGIDRKLAAAKLTMMDADRDKTALKMPV